MVSRSIRGLGLVAQKNKEGVLAYYLNNAHGDITNIVDTNGEQLNSYQYDSFGNTTTSTETVANRFKYSGEQQDNITNLYYLRARYYNPVIGRFTQEDTYRGDRLNLYAYVGNNAVNFVDPTGYCKGSIEENDGHVEMSFFYRYGGKGIEKALSNLNPGNIVKGGVKFKFSMMEKRLQSK